MKKQPKNPLHNRSPVWDGRRKPRMSLMFGIIFGLFAVAYGVAQLLAASPVIFTMTPSSQTASPGQTKTITLRVNPNGEDMNGGEVRVNYNTNHLTFSRFINPSGNPYSLSNHLNGNGFYSFNFFSWDEVDQAANIATLEFRVKSVPNTIQTGISYATSTRAYEDYWWSPDYHTVQLNGATIAVQVPEKCPLDGNLLKSDPKCQPCPYNDTIIASHKDCQAPPGTPTNPGQPDTGNPGNPDNPSNPSDAGSPPDSDGETPASPGSGSTDGTADPTDSSDRQDDVTVAAAKNTPVGAIIALILGGLLLGASGFIYLTRFRRRKKSPKTPEELKRGLFDEPSPAATTAVAAAASSEQNDTPEAEPDQATTQVETTERTAEEPVSPTPPVESKPQEAVSAGEETKPVAEEAPTSIATNETETPDLPEDDDFLDESEEFDSDKPKVSPADTVAQAALADLANTKKLPSYEQALAQEQASGLADAPRPEWQKEVIRRPQQQPVDEPEDMFELAEEHPESFGSARLLATEQPTEPNGVGDEKAA